MLFPRDNLRRDRKGQPLSDHSRAAHPDLKMKTTDFKMKVTSSHNRALPRIVTEGLQVGKLLHKIQENPTKVNILNSKINFHQVKCIRLVPQDQVTNLL